MGVTVKPALFVDFLRPPVIEQVAMEIAHARREVQANRVTQQRARVFLAGHDPVVAVAHAELPTEAALRIVTPHPVTHLQHIADADVGGAGDGDQLFAILARHQPGMGVVITRIPALRCHVGVALELHRLARPCAGFNVEGFV